jgi:uncharacterized protein
MSEALQPPNDINFARLWESVTAQFRFGPDSIHGPAHWRRVEKNGLLLATRTEADITVVCLFAVLHDACRVSEDWDEGHGVRGAALASRLRGELFVIPDESFKLLHEACVRHTEGLQHDDPTVGTCWDADRLDLGRVGMLPEERFMSTAFGKEIARCGSVFPFL